MPDTKTVTHTPGQWRALNGRTATVEVPGGLIDCEDSGESIEESRANARLVAAAPDLLAALRNLIELVEVRAPEAARWPDVEAARQAIAKAEGR